MNHLLFTLIIAAYLATDLKCFCLCMKKIFYSPYYPLIEFGFFVIVGTVAGLYGFLEV